MNLLGFNLNKISAERLEGGKGNIKITPNVKIEDIQAVKQGAIKTKDEFLGVKFSYILDYESNFAKIEFSGNLLVSVEPKLAREIIKEWKDKKLHEGFRVFLFNVILRKSNIKAIELEDELNLPLHIPFPSVSNESFKNSAENPEKKSKKD